MKLLIEIDEATYNTYLHYGNIVHSMTIGTAIKNGIPVLDNAVIGEWISVKDRLPDEGIAVLIYCPEIKCKFTAIRDLGAWHYFGGGCWNVVRWHVSDWMPLPEHEDDEEGE